MWIHPTGMERTTGLEVFIFWFALQFCLNGSVLKATRDQACVTGTFLVMASLFTKSTGDTQPQNTHSLSIKDASYQKRSSAPKAANSVAGGHPFGLLQAAKFPSKQAWGWGNRKDFAWFMCQTQLRKVNQFCSRSQRRGKTVAD